MDTPKEKIKILHIIETMRSGGVERCRLLLAKNLDKEVFDQKFICTKAEENIPEEIRAEGFEVIPIGVLKSPFQWKQHKKVQKIIEAYQPDIIHGAVFEGVIMTAVNGRLKKVPGIIIEETSDPQTRSRKANLLMKFLSKFADKVIGVSPAVTEEYLLGTLKLPARKVELINNGAALPRKVNDKEVLSARIEWGIKENDFVIGSAGRMRNDSNKRFSDLIKAFAEFSRNKGNVKLFLVGNGPELENYRKLVEDLDISDQVIFTDYQSDMTLFYKLMDVFALVSTHESFGLVLVEAMLNMLPVIATRVGGMKYIVQEGETGILVSAGAIDEVSSAMETLYADQTLSGEMGEKGYKRALENYTEEIYTKNIAALYLDLWSKKRSK